MPFQGGYVVSCHLPRALPWAVLLCPFRAVALRPEWPAYHSPARAKYIIQVLPYQQSRTVSPGLSGSGKGETYNQPKNVFISV